MYAQEIKLAMKFHRLLQTLFPSLVLLSILVTIQAKTLGPECSNKCGNITVPYPFGIEENCYLDTSYMVTCNATSGTASISGMNVDVVDISLAGHLRALTHVGRVCYNETRQVLSEETSVELSRFPLSVGRNKLMSVGCDTQSYIKTGDVSKATCATVDAKCLHTLSSSCLKSVNCCQATIENQNIETFHFKLESVRNKSGKNGYTKCSYAFVVEIDMYNYLFNSYNLTKEQFESYHMLLDWTVGNTSCETAKKSSNGYLCKENSECVDSSNAQGYRCSCSVGYQGNPYLENGCQDVNECENATLNNCTHLCYNTIGSYTCHCPKGQVGDGQKDGTRCTKKTTNVQKLGLYIGISMGFLVTSLTMFLSYGLLKQRRIAKQKEALFKRNGGTIFEKLLSEYDGSTQIVQIFTEKELKKATNNFSPQNIIGQGGFGTVYRGVLLDNTAVAIKKSKLIDPNQIRQFVNEVVLLSQINHPNIVKLVGCCLETDVPLLVYEYIVNQTLHHHLHGNPRGCLMTWRTRLNLAVETSGALAYMHYTTKIIHRDIKSSNILLSDDYTAKVSDFGISRSVPKDKMEVSTAVQGTLGYIDPEYFSSGILTEKSDVYSFGVLLVELLTGEKVNSFEANKRNRSLVDHFVLSVNEGRLIEIIDDQVKLDGSPDKLERVALLVKSCLEREGKARPTMQEVKDELLLLAEQANLGVTYAAQEIVSFCSSESDVPETTSSQFLS